MYYQVSIYIDAVNKEGFLQQPWTSTEAPQLYELEPVFRSVLTTTFWNVFIMVDSSNIQLKSSLDEPV